MLADQVIEPGLADLKGEVEFAVALEGEVAFDYSRVFGQSKHLFLD